MDAQFVSLDLKKIYFWLCTWRLYADEKNTRNTDKNLTMTDEELSGFFTED